MADNINTPNDQTSGSGDAQAFDDLTVLQNVQNQNLGDSRLNVARAADVGEGALGGLANVQQGSTGAPQVQSLAGLTGGVSVALDVAIEATHGGQVAPPELGSLPVTVDGETINVTVAATGAKPLNVAELPDLAKPDAEFQPQAPVQGAPVTFTPPVGEASGNTAQAPAAAGTPAAADTQTPHVNHAPTMADTVSVSVDEHNTVTGQFAATDVDGDPVKYHLAGGGVVVNADGTETLTNAFGSVTLDPNTGHYVGTPTTGDHLGVGEHLSTSFQVYAVDSNGAPSNTETVNVTITGSDDAPTVSVVSNATTDEHAAVSGQVSGADIDTGVVAGVTAVNDVDGTPAVADTISFHLHGNGVVASADGASETLTTAYGSVTLDTAHGTYTFTPSTGDHLGVGEKVSDSFSVVSTDNHGLSSDPATVNLTITGSDDAPVIDIHHTDTSITVTDLEGGTGRVTATDADTGVVHNATTGADVTVGAADHLTYSFGSNDDGTPKLSFDTAHGTATIDPVTGHYAFTPNDAAKALPDGSAATDHFSVTVSDGQGGSANQTIDVNVNIVGTTDHAPVIDLTTPASATDKHGASGTVHASDSDIPAGDSVSYSFGHNADGSAILSVNTDHGSVTIDPASGEYQFTPSTAAADLPRGSTVTDHVDVVATDSHGISSASSSIDISITGTTNHDPVININATDATASDHGIIKGSVVATDVDGDTASYSLTNAGTDGKLHLDSGVVSIDANGHYSFTPADGWKGGDSTSFQVQVSDGHGGTATQTVTVTEANAAPIVTSATDATGTDHLGLATGQVTASDGDRGDTLSYSFGADRDGHAITSVTTDHGTVNINASTGEFSFKPNDSTASLGEGVKVTDTLTVTVSDGHGGTTTQAVAVDITGTNDAPTISVAAPVVETENQGVYGQLSGHDVDSGDSISFHLSAGIGQTVQTVTVTEGSEVHVVEVLQTDHGSVALDTKTGIYEFKGNDDTQHLGQGQSVPDSFGVFTTDSHDASSAPTTVNVTINGTNEGPTITAVAAPVAETENQGVYGQLSGHDVDTGDTIGFHLHAGAGQTVEAQSVTSGGETHVIEVMQTEHGSVALDTQTGVYRFQGDSGTQHLGQGQSIPDSFSVFTTDNHGASSDPTTVNVTISGAESGPTLSVDAHTTDEHVAVDGQVTGSDADTGAVDGVTVGAADTVSFHLHGDGVTASADGATETLTTAHGSVTLNTSNGTYEFTPATGDHLGVGEKVADSFSVVSTDNHGVSSDPSTVNLTITGSNDAPTVTAHDDLATNQHAAVDGRVTGSDVDTGAVAGAVNADGTAAVADTVSFHLHGDGVVASADGSTETLTTAHGSVTLNTSNGTYEFTPGEGVSHLGVGAAVNDGFSVVATDNHGVSSDPTPVSVTITGTNDAPVISTSQASLTSADHTHLGGTASATDPNAGDTVSYHLVDGQGHQVDSLTTDHGTVQINSATGEYTFVPAENVTITAEQPLTDSFNVIAVDNHGATSGVETVGVTITNEGPVFGAHDDVGTTDVAGVTGHVGATDANAGDAVSYHLQAADGSLVTSITTDHGTVAINTATGDYTFTPSGGTAAMGVGDVAHDSFKVVASDNHGESSAPTTVNVTITGTNDAPTISAAVDATATDHAGVTTGHVTGADVNVHDTLSYSFGTDSGGHAITSLTTDHGTVNISASTGEFSFTPNAGAASLGAGQTAQDSFTVTVSDGHGGTATQTVAVDLTGTNDGPTVSVANVATADDHTAIKGASIGHDVDTGDTVSYHLVDGSGHQVDSLTTAHGTVTIDTTSGEYTFTPVGDASLGVGQTLGDSFKVVAVDNHGASSDPATVNVTITGSNDGPVIDVRHTSTEIEATDHTGATGHVTATDVDSGDRLSYSLGTDANGNPLTSITTDHGTVNIDANTGTYTFTPSAGAASLGAGAEATDHFTVQVSDGHGGATSQRIEVEIDGTNDKATITGTVNGAVTEDSARVASGSLNVSDADAGQAHTQAATVTDAHGTFAVDADGHWSYTLNNDSTAVQSLGVNDHLTKTFNVISADGTATQAVTVTVNGSNDAPVVGSVTGGSGTESTSSAATVVTGKITASDIDVGDTVSYSVASDNQSHHGSLTVDASGNFSFTATDNNWSGSDSFTVQASDGHGGTVNQTVNITVAGAADQATVGVHIGAGTVSPGGSFTVQNLDGEAGYSNTYGYYVTDANGNPTSGHVIWSNTHADVSQSVTITGVDPDHVGFFIIPNGHQNGSLTDNTDISFVHDSSGWHAGANGQVLTGAGSDVLFDKASLNADGLAHSRDGSVDAGNQNWEDLAGGGDRDFNDTNVAVTWNSAAPTETHPLTVTASFPDMDGSEKHSVSVGNLPAGATLYQDGVALTPVNGVYTLDATHLTGLSVKTPAGFSGDLNVTVTATSEENGTVASASASASVSDTLTNHAPTITGGTAADGHGVASGQVLATDADGNATTATLVAGQGPGHGVVNMNADGTFTYTDTNANWQAGNTDSFKVQVSDGHGGTTTQTVTVTDTDAHGPTITGGTAASGHGTASGTVLSSDADGDTTAASLVTGQGPSHGSVTVNADGTFTYTDTNANWQAGNTDSFKVQVSDGHGGTTTQTVTVTDTDAHAPTLTGDAARSGHGAISGNIGASDLDGDAVKVSLVGAGSDGTLAVSDANGHAAGTVSLASDGHSYTFTPAGNWQGGEQVTFQVQTSDGHGGATSKTITLTETDTAPTLATPTGGSGTESVTSAATVVTGKVNATDADGDTLSYAVVADSQSHHGSLTVDGSGNFTFTASENNWAGSDSFSVQVSDGHGGSTTQTVNVNVAGAADQATVAVQVGAGTETPNGSFTVTNLDSTASAGYHNTYGYYITDDAGNPTTGKIIWADVHAEPSAVANITGVDPNHVGFFIIPNGGSDNSGLKDGASLTFTKDSSGHWEAVDSSGHVLSSDGSHVLFDKTALNSDGIVHAQDGSTVSGNQNWEDLTGISGSDRDFNDVNVGVTWNAAASTETHPLTVTASFPDTDGSEKHTVSLSNLPAGSTLYQDGVALTAVNGVYSIDPTHLTGLSIKTPAGFAGDINVTVTATATENGTTATATATSATVHDDLSNHAPTAAASVSYADTTSTALSGAVSATDLDGDHLSYALATGTAGVQHGSVVLGTDGSFTYSPTTGWNGSDHFDVIVSDGHGGSVTETVNVTVAPPNHAPVIDASHTTATLSINEGATNYSNVGQVTATDQDAGDTLSYSLAAGGTHHGALTLDATSGSFIYEPSNTGWSGADTFTVNVTDSHGASVSQNVTINVSGGKTGGGNTGGTSGGHAIGWGNGGGRTDSWGDNGSWEVGGHDNHGSTTQVTTTGHWDSGWYAWDSGNPGGAGTGDTFSIAGYNQHTQVLSGHSGDTLVMGGGNDYLSLDNGSGKQMITGYDHIQMGNGDNEVVDLTTPRLDYGNVTIAGGTGHDVIWSASGDDLLVAGNGTDTIHAGAGNDTIVAGSGQDTLLGQDGNDTFLFDFGSGHATVDGGAGGNWTDTLDLATNMHAGGTITITTADNHSWTVVSDGDHQAAHTIDVGQDKSGDVTIHSSTQGDETIHFTNIEHIKF